MKNEQIHTEKNLIETDRPQDSKGKKRLKILGVEFFYLWLMGIGFALLGWIAENTIKVVTNGIFDCRFHLLPFISCYALIPFAYHILLGDPDKISFFGHPLFKKDKPSYKIYSNIICLVLILLAVFLGELIVGNLWELLFGVQLWNYNSSFLHITQYAGLVPTLGFGGGAYLLFRFVYKPLLKLIKKKIAFSVAKGLCLSLGILILLDSLVMALQIIIFHKPPIYWAIKLW